jgi:hypothetical protein
MPRKGSGENRYILRPKKFLYATMKPFFAILVLFLGDVSVVAQSQNTTFIAQEVAKISVCGVCDFDMVNSEYRTHC